MIVRFLLLLVGAALSSGISFGEDWKKIARESDESAFGLRIEQVIPASQAEQLGLKKGDFLLQLDEQQLRGWGLKRRGDEQALFFVKKGGTSDFAIVKSGKIGVYYREVFRPWIAYLRGEIGTPSDKWEEAVTEVLLNLHDNPATAEAGWEKVLETGYPADEMDAFVRAYVRWRQGKPFSAKEAFDKVVREFEVLPAVYFAKLEDLAYASNQTEVLRKLHELDPETSLIGSKYLEIWDKLKPEVSAPRNLLALAKERRAEDISEGLQMPDGAGKSARPIQELLDQKTVQVTAGQYRLHQFQVPKGVEDFHCSISTHIHCHEHSDRWASLARLLLYADSREDWEGFPSNRLARIGIGDSVRNGPYLRLEGGMTSYSRHYEAPELHLPVTLDETKEVRPRDESAPPHKLEIVKIGDEVAAYCNGICYLHLPVAKSIETMAFSLHISGLEFVLTDFDFWSLEPEKK